MHCRSIPVGLGRLLPLLDDDGHWAGRGENGSGGGGHDGGGSSHCDHLRLSHELCGLGHELGRLRNELGFLKRHYGVLSVRILTFPSLVRFVATWATKSCSCSWITAGGTATGCSGSTTGSGAGGTGTVGSTTLNTAVGCCTAATGTG